MGSVRRVLLIIVVAAIIAILGGRLYVHRQITALQRQLDEAQSQLQIALDKSDAVRDKQLVEVATDIASIRSQLDKDIPAGLQTQYQDLVQRIAALALSSSADTSSSAKDLLAQLTNSAGTGIAVSGPNSVTISNTGVLSVNGGNGAVTIKGTANQVSVASTGSTIRLGLPQDIAASSSPSFASLAVSGALGAASLSGDGSGVTNVDALTLQGNNPSHFTNASNLNAGTIADARLSSNVALLNAANVFTTGQSIQTGAVGTNGLAIQGASGQTANLTEWRDSVSTVLSAVDAAGRFGLGTATPTRTLDVNGNAKFSNAAGKNIYTGQFEASGLFGNANSLSTGSSSGDLILAGGGPSNPGGAIVLDGGGTGSGDVAKGIGFYVGPNVGSFPALMMSLTSGGVLRVASTGTPGTVEKFRVNTPTTVDNAAATVLSTGGPANKALVVQAAASQTANLQEWQTSAGTVTGAVNSGGAFTFYANPLITALTGTATRRLVVNSAANNSELVLRRSEGTFDVPTAVGSGSQIGQYVFAGYDGSAYQTGAGMAGYATELYSGTARGTGLRWFTTASTTTTFSEKMRLTNAGALEVGGTLTETPGTVEKLRVNTPTTTDNAAATVLSSGGAANKALVVQAAASQTSNIFEIQSSGGTAIAYATASGSLVSAGSVSASTFLQVGTNPAASGSLRLPNNVTARWRNAANSADVDGIQVTGSNLVQLGGSGSAGITLVTGSTEIARAGSQAFMVNSTGSPGTVERFRVNSPTTTDNSAATVLATGASGSKGLVIQGAASQTANLQEWQSSTGTVLASLDANGNLSVRAATVMGNLTVNGHYISGNASGSTTIAAGAAAGASPTVSISGNDTSGTITVTTGASGVGTGTLATITFANAYGAAPRVVFTPKTAAGAALQLYNSTATGTFTINTSVAPTPGTSYTFDYHVIQ